MCGICAYIGFDPGYQYAVEGLFLLQSRGYDSCGICSYHENSGFTISKYATTETISSYDLLVKEKDKHFSSNVMILHNRWATHGSKTDINAHPHMCNKNKFVLVHNGIIENYTDIKKELIERHSIKFISQTDTEVIVNLISICYEQIKDIELAIEMALGRLTGTWGLVIMCIDSPNKLYCARHGSPLLIGFGENYAMIASEQSGFCKYVNYYNCLNDNDIVVLEKIDGHIDIHKKSHNKCEYEKRKITIQIDAMTPCPYPHWTLKEINEQYQSSLRAMGMGGRIVNDKEVKLGGLMQHIKELHDVNNLILLGCGTSYYAGLHCISLFKKISGFNIVEIYDGSEFTSYDIPKIGKTALLLLSQSGETRDLYHTLEIGRDNNLYMIGVINVVDSLIAREVNCGVYLNAGKEVAVASTKSFTSQIIVLNMIATWFAQIKGINEYKRAEIIHGLRTLPLDIETTLNTIKEQCKIIANYLKDYNDAFIIGKGMCEAIAREGALKIKEISYIHAEGYASSSLKHGPYSLIQKGSPVIIIIPEDEHFIQNINIIEEIKSRHAFVIAIADKNLNNDKIDICVKISQNYSFRGILSVIVLQLIAYETACAKNINPDFPRNLAKVITVQ